MAFDISNLTGVAMVLRRVACRCWAPWPGTDTVLEHRLDVPAETFEELLSLLAEPARVIPALAEIGQRPRRYRWQ